MMRRRCSTASSTMMCVTLASFLLSLCPSFKSCCRKILRWGLEQERKTPCRSKDTNFFRGWTGTLSWPKRWNLPPCQSSERQRTSVTLTRSSLASSQSSPSHEQPASSLQSNKKSLLTLTSLSWVDPGIFPFVLPYHCDMQFLIIATFICHETLLTQQELRKWSPAFFYADPHFQLHDISLACLLQLTTKSLRYWVLQQN